TIGAVTPATPSRRATVAWSMVREPSSGCNCLGCPRRESGHSRDPRPPDISTGTTGSGILGRLPIGPESGRYRRCSHERESMYQFLLFLHIAAAAAWIGAALRRLAEAPMVRTGAPVARALWHRSEVAMGTRYFAPAAVVVLVSGIFMVLDNEAVGFGTP